MSGRVNGFLRLVLNQLNKIQPSESLYDYTSDVLKAYWNSWLGVDDVVKARNEQYQQERDSSVRILEFNVSNSNSKVHTG